MAVNQWQQLLVVAFIFLNISAQNYNGMLNMCAASEFSRNDYILFVNFSLFCLHRFHKCHCSPALEWLIFPNKLYHQMVEATTKIRTKTRFIAAFIQFYINCVILLELPKSKADKLASLKPPSQRWHILVRHSNNCLEMIPSSKP